MSIDINQPVKQGEDLVINESGESHLGTYAEFEEKAAKGLIAGVHLDKAEAEAVLGETQPEPKPKRDSRGHFAKKEDASAE